MRCHDAYFASFRPKSYKKTCQASNNNDKIWMEKCKKKKKIKDWMLRQKYTKSLGLIFSFASIFVTMIWLQINYDVRCALMKEKKNVGKFTFDDLKYFDAENFSIDISSLHFSVCYSFFHRTRKWKMFRGAEVRLSHTGVSLPVSNDIV